MLEVLPQRLRIDRLTVNRAATRIERDRTINFRQREPGHPRPAARRNVRPRPHPVGPRHPVIADERNPQFPRLPQQRLELRELAPIITPALHVLKRQIPLDNCPLHPELANLRLQSFPVGQIRPRIPRDDLLNPALRRELKVMSIDRRENSRESHRVSRTVVSINRVPSPRCPIHSKARKTQPRRHEEHNGSRSESSSCPLCHCGC
jgi:hypothetical protein